MEKFLKIFEKEILLARDNFKKQLLNSQQNTVWHALNLENAIKCLEEGQMRARTTQRYWKNGRRYQDKDPEYESSHYLTGWSTTRNKNYALQWNSVIFELDLNEIKKHFPVMPFNWGFSFNSKNKKREQEEFIIAHKGNLSVADMQKEFDNYHAKLDDLFDKIFDYKRSKDKGNSDFNQETLDAMEEQIKQLESNPVPFWTERMKQPKGKPLPLDKVLKGIYVNTLQLDFPNIEIITQHPLFKGVVIKNKKQTNNTP